MSYKVQILPNVLKKLKKIDWTNQLRIIDAINALEEDPRPHGCKKLRSREVWRIRVGKYRIIYEIQDNNLIVLVVRIGHRKDVYDY